MDGTRFLSMPSNWWTTSLFPAGLTREDESAGRFYRGPWAWLLLLGLASLLFLSRLDAPLLEPQEARYAEIARQMLREGRWVVPVLHGQDYLDKPPLLYWLIMASYQIFGVHDWAARLVPGFAGILTVMVAYVWARRTVGVRAAFWAALVLCLSVRFVYLERMLVMDGLLTLWVVLAWALAHLALVERDGALCFLLPSPLGRREQRATLPARLIPSGLACALGLLTKGPIALVLVIVPMVVFTCFDQRAARVSWWTWLVYVLISCGLAAPWYIATSLAVPGFAYEFFWHHHVDRFVRPFDHQEPFWFYLPGLLLGMVPWIVLVPGMVMWLFRGSAMAQRPSAIGFFLLAALWPMAFFSASGCKRPVYIVPALPPLALALGCYLNTREGKGWPVCAALTAVLLVCGVEFLLPAYNESFALRSELRGDRDLPVVCYPQRYDSVSFYCPHVEVESFSLTQRAEMIEALLARPKTLLLIKSGHGVQELLREMPTSLIFTAHGGTRGAFTALMVSSAR